MTGMYAIISDTHFGHENILKFERKNRFRDIQEHDEVILAAWERCVKSLRKGDTFYFLGDFCAAGREKEYANRLLSCMEQSACRKVMVMGNHDRSIDKELLTRLFDEVYDYPIYISHRVVLSHFPCAVYNSQVNVHGHTHGMELCDLNHMCASIHVNKYLPMTGKSVESRVGKVDNWCTKFLYEPWAADYKLTQPHDDVIVDANHRIDLSASRLNYNLHKQAGHCSW